MNHDGRLAGVAAVVAAAVAIWVGAGLLISEDEDSTDESAQASGSSTTTTMPVEIITWSIAISGEEVLLTGELPYGYPTETYVNGELVDRDEGGDFAWDLDKRVPDPVALQDGMSCSELEAEWDFWIDSAATSTVRDSQVRQLAYAQHAVNLYQIAGC